MLKKWTQLTLQKKTKNLFKFALNSLSAARLNATSLKCISMTNQECKVRPEIVYVNSDEPVF